ncbi:unnamed protein product [Thelazia callipaeda]|uniref:FIP-RBD domain-containing protein n=1 Tax=Thelazia callipaeda TaxID=103827 RepID=A0A0N5CQ51_THECL|nr:unnamed protein product [Thelazia callipaeda]
MAAFSSHGKLDILKRKVQNVKKKNLGPSSDTSSFLNPSLNAINRRSSLCEVCPSPAKSPGRNSMVDFSRNGLITPPAAVPIFGDDSTSFDSRSTWITLNRNSSSNSLTCERHGRLESPVASRAHSIISSGFGSTSSTITNSLDRASIAHTLSCEQLLSKMNDLRLELAQKDAKISDLHDYIGKLLARIIEKDPEILEIESPAGIFSNNT